MIAVTLSLLVMVGSPSGEDQIRSRYALWDKAYVARDVKTLASVLDSSFVLINGRGVTVSRKDYVARLWKSELLERYETKVLKVKFDRNTATAWTLELSKKAGAPMADHRYEDTWRLHEGRWKLIKSKTVGGH